jgi:F-type H+-transporting ATPase subunit a
MKLIVLLSTILSTSSAFAGGGFLWFGDLAHSLHIPEHVIHFAFVALIMLALGILYRVKSGSVEKSLIPESGVTFKNIYEFIGEFAYDLARGIMGDKEAKKFFPVAVMLFSLIFMSNILGLIPGFLPPTENINTTLACGVFVFLYYNYHGIKAQGIVGHIKHLMGPILWLAPLMFVIELISHLVRPMSLGLRLQGNMTGDHMVLSVFNEMVPIGIPMVFYGVGMFVCFIQAFVFTLLTLVYIGLATEHHDHEAH